METRANYALIGVFTLAVITAGFLFVYWFSGRQGANRRVVYEVEFSGSVSGLGAGSSVLFNGIRVGEVTKVSFDPEDPRKVITTIEVAQGTEIREDTHARLDVQMLSGVASIALSGGAASSPARQPCPASSCRIQADRSEFQDLIESARNIARNATETLEKLNGLIAKNEPAITETIQNVNRFAKALGDNADGVDRFLTNVGQAAKTVETLAAELDSIVKKIDGEQVQRIVANVDKFTTALGTSSPEVETTIKNVSSISAKLDKAADQIDGLLKAAQGFLNSPDGKGAFQEIAEAARSVNTLARNLDKRTAEITVGINRFTGSGLREVQELAVDGRRTLNEINRTLRGVERNPQQFIFGGQPPLPEYNGRR